MYLLKDVEPIIQLLNSPHVGKYIESEIEGEPAKNKDNVEHFVMIHSSHPEIWDESRETIAKKRTTRKKKVEVVDEGTNDEDDFDDSIGRNEEKVEFSEEDTLLLVRRMRKIDCGSTKVLADNGWFLCPIYAGMTSLRPIVSRVLPRKKGYKLVLLKTPICEIPDGTFTKENLKEWELNSVFQLNPIFSRHPELGLSAMSVFVHKKDDSHTKIIRNSINRLVTTQKTRIKLGNILVDEVLTNVGQEAYIRNKENLAKADGKKSDITDFDLNDVKIIDYIEKAYKKVNDTAKDMGVKAVPIRNRKTFEKVMEAIKEAEKKEHMERARRWFIDYMAEYQLIKEWNAEYITWRASLGDEEPIIPPTNPGAIKHWDTVEHWKEVYTRVATKILDNDPNCKNVSNEDRIATITPPDKPNYDKMGNRVYLWVNSWIKAKTAYLESLPGYKNMTQEEIQAELVPPTVPTQEDALNETWLLETCNYIPQFIVYLNIQSYLDMIVRAEKDAELVVKELVHNSWIWEYLDGIRGCGEITAAHILANIDFRSTVHPSSVLRYLGMDNVVTAPKRGENEKMSEETRNAIIDYLFLDYERINARVDKSSEEDEDDIELCKDNFFEYATQFIECIDDYATIRNAAQNRDAGNDALMDPKFKAIVDNVWLNADIVYYEKDGVKVPAIKKHARSKKDSVITTYLDKNGNIGTKKSLGYNTKLKSSIIEIMFGSMMKAGNPYYIDEIYWNKRRQLDAKYKAMGLNPEEHKNHIHMQARRFTVQIFIEKLWMWARTRLGYPTNGGTYYEAKILGMHGHGTHPDSILNR